MQHSIAKKLSATYITIVIATMVSATFCFYVLNTNERTNSEMRYVTLPSLENLKEMKLLMLDVKKLTNTWVYIPNNKDRERLKDIIDRQYPVLGDKLNSNAGKWKDKSAQLLFKQIDLNNGKIIEDARQVITILNNPESYTNDSLADMAISSYNHLEKRIGVNAAIYDKIIEDINHTLALQPVSIASLLRYLYLIVLLTMLIVISVSLFSMGYSKNYIVSPLLKLNKTILDMAKGDAIMVSEVERKDEIGQMHNAISKMVNGILQKIKFSEKIGKGDYITNYTLLSDRDKLGLALITMRDNLKSSNDALRKNEKRLIDAQKLAKIGDYVLDIKSCEFQSSAALDEILGIGDGFEKIDANWKKLILLQFRARIIKKSFKCIEENVRFEEQCIIKRYNDGQDRWINVIGEYTYDNENKPVLMVGTIQDITESKTLEIELNNSYKVATEQNRRLLNFSYIVSHNLRMHSVNINGLLSLISDADSEEERNEFLQHLANTSAHLGETMDHLNDVVAMQNAVNVEVESLEINKYIDNAINVLETQIKNKNAIIKKNIHIDTTIKYNPAYLDSILLNFVSNSLKYCHPERQPEITIDFYKDLESSNKKVLRITDNGIGIDLDKHGNKLFGMYKTFHNNKDAKGIGLFMTKYQIEAMGGSVEVESEIDKGTTFKIFIK